MGFRMESCEMPAGGRHGGAVVLWCRGVVGFTAPTLRDQTTSPPDHPTTAPPHRHTTSPGYTLAGLMIVLIVLEVAVALALPLWSGAAKRDREEEMIFRGLQYAEAVRVFQQLEGRLPAGLKELAEHEPRVLRQAWTNPIEYQEGWLPLFEPESLQEIETPGQAGQRRQVGGGQGGLSGPVGEEFSKSLREARENRRGIGNSADQRRAGRRQARRGSPNRRGAGDEQEEPEPFLGGSLEDLEESSYGAFFGVKPGSGGESILTFFGGEDYADWEFRPELLVQPPNPDGRIPVPRMWSQRFWVPVPGAGEPEGGSGPSEMGDDDRDRGDRTSTFGPGSDEQRRQGRRNRGR